MSKSKFPFVLYHISKEEDVLLKSDLFIFAGALVNADFITLCDVIIIVISREKVSLFNEERMNYWFDPLLSIT